MSPPRKREKTAVVARPPLEGVHTCVIQLKAYTHELKKSKYPSSTVEVGGVKWRASFAKERVPKRLGGGGCKVPELVVSLDSVYSPSLVWSIDVNARFELFNADHSKNIVKEKTHTFDSKSRKCREIIIAWRDLIDREKGFTKPYDVKLKVSFAIISIKGFNILGFDFTDPEEPRHDVALVLNGEKLYASKATLATYSQFFYAMFYGGFNERGKKEIELKDVDREEFLELLRVIYPFSPSHQKITDDNVEYLLNLADRFEISLIMVIAENHLICPYSCKLELPVKLLLSDRYRLIKLQSHCLDNFTLQGKEEIKASEEYTEFSDELKKYLDDLPPPLTDPLVSNA